MSNTVRRLSAAITAGVMSAVVLSTMISGSAAQAATAVAVQTPMQASLAGAHTVRPGDTLSRIAAKHGMSLAAIFAANNMGMGTLIYPGQKIRVRPAATAPAAKPPAKRRPQPAAAAATTHIVKPGDTLGQIAASRGVSLSSLLSTNGMSMRTVIYPGQKILLTARTASAPAAKPATTPAPKPAPKTAAAKSHLVKPGDSLSRIAASHGVRLSFLLSANGMNLRTIIYPGQKILLAARSAPAARKTAPVATSPSSAQLKTSVAATARRMGVDPSLALAFAMQESTFRQNVTSSAGAVGTMQVMPTSGEWASQLVGRPLDLRNTQDNITAGVAIISALLTTSPSKEIAIASYYQGQYSVMNRGMYEDTKAYVASVLKHQKTFR